MRRLSPRGEQHRSGSARGTPGPLPHIFGVLFPAALVFALLYLLQQLHPYEAHNTAELLAIMKAKHKKPSAKAPVSAGDAAASADKAAGAGAVSTNTSTSAGIGEGKEGQLGDSVAADAKATESGKREGSDEGTAAVGSASTDKGAASSDSGAAASEGAPDSKGGTGDAGHKTESSPEAQKSGGAGGDQTEGAGAGVDEGRKAEEGGDTASAASPALAPLPRKAGPGGGAAAPDSAQQQGR